MTASLIGAAGELAVHAPRALGAVADSPSVAVHALTEFSRAADGTIMLGGKPVPSFGTVLALDVPPLKGRLLPELERRGAAVLNRSEAVRASSSKVNLAPVLERAGVPHLETIAVRTPEHLHEAAGRIGFPLQVVQGGSAAGGRTTYIDNADDLAAFANLHLGTTGDRAAVSIVQPHVAGERLQVVVAGDRLLGGIALPQRPRSGGDTGALGSAAITLPEENVARRAGDAFGLDIAAVDLVRRADGSVVVTDVSAAPGITRDARTAISNDADLIAHLERRAAASDPTATIARRHEEGKVAVGVLNMRGGPGKNINRVLAEEERQGGTPRFVALPDLNVGDDGALLYRGERAADIDVFLTRTGAVIDDAGIQTLERLERSGHRVVNGSDAMRMSHDKITASERLVSAGVPVPGSVTVNGVEDVKHAIDLLGTPIVLKIPSSSEGRGVMFHSDAIGAISTTRALFSVDPKMVLKAEPWFREAAGADTRVHVVGGKVVAAMRREAGVNEYGEAASNLALGGSARHVDPTPEQQRIAVAAVDALGLEVGAADIIDTRFGPKVIEVNSSPGLDIEQASGPVADHWVRKVLSDGAGARDARVAGSGPATIEVAS